MSHSTPSNDSHGPGETKSELERRVAERTVELEETIDRLRTEVTRRELAEQILRERSRNLEDANEELQQRAGQLQELAMQLTTVEDRERQRLATLLHDDLQQLLVAARFQLDTLRRKIIDGDADGAMVDSIIALVLESVEKSRTLSHELSPPVLHQQGLRSAFRWLCSQMKPHHGLDVDLRIVGKIEPISEAVKLFLFRAVQELLFNVAKHAGVFHASVELKRTGSWLEATVVDKGKGFDPESLQNHEKAEGMGLFSIAERAEFLGGRLDIESESGQGSRFALYVPDRMKEKQTPGTYVASADVEEIAGPMRQPAVSMDMCEGSRLRVLLADDHRLMRKGLAMLLAEEDDLKVVGAADNGQQACELARRLQPDVIVMDVSMPGLNGIDATRRIKGTFPAIRIVALSMYEQQEVSSDMYDAGANACLSKRGPSEELLAAIRGGQPRSKQR